MPASRKWLPTWLTPASIKASTSVSETRPVGIRAHRSPIGFLATLELGVKFNRECGYRDAEQRTDHPRRRPRQRSREVRARHRARLRAGGGVWVPRAKTVGAHSSGI